MIPPNDIPADTELREQVHAIILKTDDYMKFCAIQDMPWNRSGNLLDELMQLIKARDAAIRLDMAERFDGAYLRYLKWEAPTDSEEESIWLTRDELLAELSTPTDQKEKE